MKTLIQHARVIDPSSQRDEVASIAIASGRIVAVGAIPSDFVADKVVDAAGLWALPGLIDLCVRLREPGHEYASMLESEMMAAVAGGVTALVCPPDTDPVLDEPGLVEMLKSRAGKLHQARVFPLGALTRGLKGEALTEMVQLSESGCVGFSQAEQRLSDTRVLMRAMQYAATYGYTVWLYPQDPWLSQGVVASGPLATRMGLSGVPVAAECIALHTIFELMKSTKARVHLCRLSSAAGLELVKQAKAQGLALTCDVSIQQLHLTDIDIGHYDPCMRLYPVIRQNQDRLALRQGLAEGTIDALVSDHNPVAAEGKKLPFAQAEAGASAVEYLASLAFQWAREDQLPYSQALARLTQGPVKVLQNALGTLQDSMGKLVEGGVADLCLYDPQADHLVRPQEGHSQGKHTPFMGRVLQGQIVSTWVNGRLAFQRS